MPKVIFVLPCLNEKECLPLTFEKLEKKYNELVSLNKISADSRILFVDDGSTDSTWSLISEKTAENAIFTGVKLSRNFGQQNALMAGMTAANGNCDCVITLDADLQDDLAVIDLMLTEFANGNSVVYGVRSDRSSDTAFKSLTAELFYTIADKFSTEGTRIVYNHADCRLLGASALNVLCNEFPESDLFLRGIVPLAGFQSASVSYARAPRQAGKTKYNLMKMFSFAVKGIMTVSVKPIRIFTYLGAVMSVVFLFVFFGEILFARGEYAPLMIICSLLCIIGNIIILAIGVVGEYVGRTYMASKNRPRYIIEKDLTKE